MNWRRVLVWLGLAAVLIGSVLLIARVSIMAFSNLQRSEGPRDRGAAVPVAPTEKDAPARTR